MTVVARDRIFAASRSEFLAIELHPLPVGSNLKEIFLRVQINSLTAVCNRLF